MAWLPLESNPEVMTKFLQKLGVPDKWKLTDVFGLDSESLNWVPRPVLAVILLFPCNEQFEEFSKEQCKQLEQQGQTISPDVYFVKQIVSNACGTIALIHSVANNMDRIALSDGPFKQVLEDSMNLDADARSELLQKASTSVIGVHQELAMEGQTEVNPNQKVMHHFVAFVERNGNLYELDGRKPFPINHGATNKEKFLEDAARVCQDYIKREPNDVNFTVLALTAADN